MAGFYPCFKVVEVLCTGEIAHAFRGPTGNLRERRSHIGLEKHIPARGPHLHHNMCKAHVCNTFAVGLYVLPGIAILGKIRSHFHPDYAGLLNLLRGARQQGQQKN